MQYKDEVYMKINVTLISTVVVALFVVVSLGQISGSRGGDPVALHTWVRVQLADGSFILDDELVAKVTNIVSSFGDPSPRSTKYAFITVNLAATNRFEVQYNRGLRDTGYTIVFDSNGRVVATNAGERLKFRY
jgi:hypothetical protein